MFSCSGKGPNKRLTILEPQNLKVGEFYRGKNWRSTAFEALNNVNCTLGGEERSFVTY